MRWPGFCFLVLALNAPRAEAINPARSIAQYAHASWGAKDGLPEGPVLAIHETREGFLWVGTLSALVQFDGQRFVSFEEGRLGLGHYSHARDLLELPDGAIYAGLVGGVARGEHGRFDFYAEQAGLAHPFVYALAPGPLGSVWVGSGGTGIWQLRNGAYTRHPAYVKDPALPSQVNDLATAPDGTLWAATDRGLLELGDQARIFSTGQGLPSAAVRVLAFDRGGDLWVGTHAGLARLHAGRFQIYTKKQGLPGDDISALLVDRAGVLWIGTYQGGLARLVQTRIEPAMPGSTPTNGGVFALAEGRDGALWVGTGVGLERYTDGAFVTLGASSGFASENIFNVAPRRAGGLWVLDATGALLTYEEGRARTVLRPGTITGEGMLGLFESEDGSLWIGGAHLHRLRDGKYEVYDHPGGEFAVIIGDGDGLLLAQTDGDGTSTLARFQNGHFEPVSTPERLSHVQRLTRDREGRLWISTGGSGLVRLSKDESRVFRTRDGLPHDVVYGLAEEAGGTLWIATRAGLARLRGDRIDNLAEVTGLPHRAPMHLQLDGLGALWVTGDDGIHRIALGELDAAADGQSPSVSTRRFTSADGLKTREISWRCAAQARTADGKIWYATSRGVSVIDPHALPRPAAPPPVRLEDLIVDGRPVAPAAAVSVGVGRERIEIRYSAPSLSNPNELTFRYRLGGYDADWVDARVRRTAYYTGLPAGDYAFQVGVRRSDGDWSPQTADMRLRIEPRWNETGLARGLFVLGGSLTLLGMFRFRVRRMRAQKQVLVKQVAERTAELRAEITERRNAEEEVRRLNAELEARVRDRTAELETANLALAADVAARQRTEAALADEKEKLSVTLRSLAEGVVAVDLEGRVLMMNPVAERLTGWAPAEASRKPLSEVLPLSDRFTRGPLRRDPIDSVLSAGEGGGELTRALLIGRDGREILLDTSTAPIHDGRGRAVGAVLVFRDVTERTRIEEQIQKTQKLEAIGILAGGIAHDFNNLLTGIFGHVDLARGALAVGTPARGWLDDVLHALDSARGLARQLLTFASGGTNAGESHALHELLDRSARFVLSGSGVSVELAIPGELRPCEVDPLQIRQVVDNLLLNARQALPAGGHVKIEARNVDLTGKEPRGLPAGRYVEIAISDDGPGIPEGIRDRIFDPFFTTKSTGTGLGLATVRSIVSQHGGTVDFEPRPGGGTTFRLVLRAAAGEGVVKPPAAAPAPAPKAAARGNGRILVMDDEPQIRNLLKVGLELEGYEVDVTSGGEEAVALHARARAEGRPFTLAILDLTIAGGLGGVDTLARLRAADPTLPAIASSGYSRDETLSDPRAAGFDGILPKPYKLDDLAAVVANIIGP